MASARLLTDLPEIEAQIVAGSLNITNLHKIQSFVRAEKAVQHELSKDEKLSLIAECENKPTRKVAEELIKKSHQPALLAEKFHMASSVLNDGTLNSEYQKFDALLDAENTALLQEFKNLYAHELQDCANISVLTFLLKKAVQYKKKKLGLVEKTNKVVVDTNAPLPMSTKVNSQKVSPLRKSLPVAVKRYVWQRAGACCEYRDPKVNLRCNSSFALQPDHIVPLALGGTDEVTNLQLLCRAHNSRRAIKTFGVIRK